MKDIDTTIVIKVHYRLGHLVALMDSIRQVVPWPIIVADDSRPNRQAQIAAAVAQVKDAEHLALDYDVGIAAGRNAGVDRVTTSSFILMEEDLLVPVGTELWRLVDHLQNADIVGGVLNMMKPTHTARQTFAGQLTSKPHRGGLHVHHEADPPHGVRRVDHILNFFAARTDVVKAVRWNDSLKLCEHFEFFWRVKQAGLKVLIHNGVEIDHDHRDQSKREGYYGQMRGRARPMFADQAMKIHNITRWTDSWGHDRSYGP